MSKCQNSLETKRDALLKTQQTVSLKFNRLLTRKEGLNDTSFQVRKNLTAAICVSKQPGFFEYYKVSSENTDVEKSNLLGKMTKEIKTLQLALDSVNHEIEVQNSKTAKTQKKNLKDVAANAEKNIGSFQQWFTTYGDPAGIPPDGWRSSFTEDPKIYGGTGHHAGFKTQAKVMRRGRLTR